jgi:lipopolysaccharide/colanic/teichoic acid biosynthesis glycosyltransferase
MLNSYNNEDRVWNFSEDIIVNKNAVMRLVGIALIDLLLLLLSFFTIHVLKYGIVAIGDRHDNFIILVLLCWLGLSIILKKFSSLHRFSLIQGVGSIASAALMMTGLISLILVMLGLTNLSRILVYGTIFLHAGLELAAFFIYYSVAKKQDTVQAKIFPLKGPAWSNTSRSLVVSEAFLLIISLVLATYVKQGTLKWSANNFDILYMFFGVWLLTSLVLRKFETDNFHSVYSLVALNIKSSICMAVGLAIVIHGLHYYYLSRSRIFGTLLIFLVLELILFCLYYRHKDYKNAERKAENQSKTSPRVCQCPLQSAGEKNEPCPDPVDLKIHHALHFFEPNLYPFIRKNVDLVSIDASESALVYTDNFFNLDVMKNCACKLIINLHKINDMRFLNQYFLLAQAKLKPNGYLVGKAHTLDTHRSHFFRHFSGEYLSRFLYMFDFLWHRIFPKLPVAKKLYFALTKGRNRLVSKAEVFGRLFFCGFRPISEIVISDRLYFIAQKVMTPSEDANPTYGPLVGLTRSGIHDKPITVYKFRTMHPFAEYLQTYIYEKNNLAKGGKFKNDFRVTKWGCFMRKFWIDELPMLYNWLRGDLQLIGVRPLSRQYLEMYSSELRELRKKVKPGLLPPFYADMPTTLEEIMASEGKYIESYLKYPIRTQVRYFFRCTYNILAKKARSR